MAIGNFTRARSEQAQDDGEETLRPSAPVPSQSGMGTLSAFIDQGSEFEGKLSFRDTVRIDGLFRGEIRSENTLVIGETGEIEADVTSGHVVISGSLIGNVRAEKAIVLHKTARVEGTILLPVAHLPGLGDLSIQVEIIIAGSLIRRRLLLRPIGIGKPA